MTDTPALLQVDDLHVRYADGVDALRGVSLTINPAERVGLIGPNGAGKTTLMLSIMNAVRFTGRIVVDAIEVSKKDRARNSQPLRHDLSGRRGSPVHADPAGRRGVRTAQPGLRHRRSPAAG